MDFSSIHLDYQSILAGSMIIIGGFASIWCLKVVINIFKNDVRSSTNNISLGVPDYGPPRGDFTDYDPNGNYFRRDGMWRKYDDFL